jgi:hypothetical protein
MHLHATVVVSLTEVRREMLDAARAVEDPAPLRFDALGDDEVAFSRFT